MSKRLKKAPEAPSTTALPHLRETQDVIASCRELIRKATYPGSWAPTITRTLSFLENLEAQVTAQINAHPEHAGPQAQSSFEVARG